MSNYANVGNALIYLIAIFLLTPSLATIINYVVSLTGAGFIAIDVFDEGNVWHQIAAALVLLIITDFFYYWWHRAQHTIPILWEQHVVHHADESVNVTTSSRHHWTEFVFQSLLITLPMSILFKLSSVSMWSVATIVAAYGWFIHMNVRVGLGHLSWLACTPQLHRIHHSVEPAHFDKNFAAYFPIWDVLFGTYYHPKPGEYPATGVAGRRFTSAVAMSVHPFHAWWCVLKGKLR